MGRVLRLAEDIRLERARFENFSDRPVNFFKEIVQDPMRAARPSVLTNPNVALRLPESEKRKQAVEVEKARLEGIEQGKSLGREVAQRELMPALELMQQYATMLAAERADLSARFEEQLVSLATQMAEKILNAELNVKPEMLVGIVKNALRSVTEAKQVTLRVHPQDLELLRAKTEEIAAGLSSSAVLDLRPDDSLRRGDCLVDSDIGSLDAKGNLLVVGRKVNAFHLKTGETIFPELVENVLRGSRFVERVLVFGENEATPVALVVPDFHELLQWLVKHTDIPAVGGYADTPEHHRSFWQPLLDGVVKQLYAHEFAALLAESGLPLYARPVAFHLFAGRFHRGAELTLTLKPRRGFIREQLEGVIFAKRE